MKDKMKHFSTYIRAALACYVSMTSASPCDDVRGPQDRRA